MDMDTREFICEVCEKTEMLTNDEAFEAGWDYPPFIGAFGVVSPRTCPDCDTMSTAWWAMMVEKISPEDLDPKKRAAIERILLEVPHE